MNRSRSLTWRANGFCLLIAAGLVGLAWWLGEDGRTAMAERASEGRTVRVVDHVQTMTWWVAAAGAGLMILAAITAPWWTGPRDGLGSIEPSKVGTPGWRWWLGVGAILVVAAWLRAERLDLSLYNDEAYMFRRYVAGQFKTDNETGELRHRLPDWATTGWHMEVGNNSPPYSLLARLSYEQTGRMQPLATAEVHEQSIRLPAYVAGVAGLLVLALGARAMGSPDRGFFVLAAGAFHPWMIRYASEGRGHGLLLLLVPLLVLALWKALRSGLWRWWLSVGAVSLLMMWTFPIAVHALIALNLMLAFGWWRRWRRPAERERVVAVQLPRWLLANALAAFFFVLLFAPVLSQMNENLRGVESLRGAPEWSWWVDMGSWLTVGMPWYDQNPDSPVASSVARFAASHNWLPLVALGLVAAVSLLGWFWWCRRSDLGRVLGALGFGGPVVGFALSQMTDSVLHPWYLLVSLPALLLMGGGVFGWLEDLAGRVPRPGWWAGVVILALWLAGVGPVVLRQLKVPVQPQREAVELVRGGVYPDYLEREEQVVLAAFYTDFGVYDPYLTQTWSVTALEEAEAEALRAGRPLYVAFAHRQLARESYPALVDYVEASGRYMLAKELHGTGHRQFNHHVYRWLRGTDNPGEQAGEE